MKREGELQLTAKLQPPEWDATFCRCLVVIGELLQLEFIRVVSMYLSGKCDVVLSLTEMMSVLQPLNPKK